MIYITGDTHGSFERVENFCQRFNTKNDDIMIILGDAGINFSGPRYDRLKKRQLEELPITIFAIHGNHEQRPFTIESYKEQVWNGGMVYYEEEFPSILFAKDGEVYNLNGLKTIVMGGAYSIDKAYRLAYGYGWWEDEPVEVFMSGVDQSKVDKSTENWLDKIEDRLSYKKWYCGHYHTEKKIDNLEIMFENFDEFGSI